nr:hypothetical protein [uncultured Mucilaginibacter sp.]
MQKLKWIWLLIVFCGCGTLKLRSTWQAPESTGANYQKILVTGLITAQEDSLPDSLEEDIAAEIKAVGYPAVSCYKEYGFEKHGQNLSEVLGAAGKSRFDAVFTVALVHKSSEKQFIPYHQDFTLYISQYNMGWLVQNNSAYHIFEPGYWIENVKCVWEINLYELPSQKLIYSSQTESFDGAIPAHFGRQYGAFIVKDLIKKHVLFRKKQPKVPQTIDSANGSAYRQGTF